MALLIAAAVCVGVVLYEAREALAPFLVGVLLAFVLDTPVELLSRARVPRWLSILLIYAAVVSVVVVAINLVSTVIVGQTRSLLEDLPGLVAQLQAELARLAETYRGLDLPREVRELIDRQFAEFAQRGAAVDIGALIGPVFTSGRSLAVAMFAYLIIPVWVFYLLKDRPSLSEAFERSVPLEWRDDARAVVLILDRAFGRWLAGQLVLCVAVGSATFGGLLLLSAWVDPIFGRYAVLLAVIAGVLELLPILGPIIAAIPAVMLGATAGAVPTVAVLALYVVVQQVENAVLVPRIQGRAVHLHPTVVIFAIVAGGAVAGLLGAILALPVTAAARDVYRYLFRRLSPPGATPADALTVTFGGTPPVGAARPPAVLAPASRGEIGSPNSHEAVAREA